MEAVETITRTESKRSGMVSIKIFLMSEFQDQKERKQWLFDFVRSIWDGKEFILRYKGKDIQLKKTGVRIVLIKIIIPISSSPSQSIE